MNFSQQVVLQLEPDRIRRMVDLRAVNRFRGFAGIALADDYEKDVTALVERLDLLRDRARELCEEDFMPGKKKKKR